MGYENIDTHGNDIDEKDTILNFKDLRNTLCDVVLSNIRITWTLFTEVAGYYPLFYDSVDIGGGWGANICVSKLFLRGC